MQPVDLSEDTPPSSRRKLELVIESLNEQITFWENKLNDE